MTTDVAEQWEAQTLDTMSGLVDDPHMFVDALAVDNNLTERQKGDLHSMVEVRSFFSF